MAATALLERVATRALATFGCVAEVGKFTPEEQEFKCMLAPEAFAAIPNAWGRQGWTTATLSKLSKAELQDALKIAWAHGAAKKGKKK